MPATKVAPSREFDRLSVVQREQAADPAQLWRPSVSPQINEALLLYNLSAAQGDGEGMNALGDKYQFGTGVAQDLALAIHWYCQAVEAGSARGMNNLAIFLSQGLGVPRDEEQARDLWRPSAALGHVNAMSNLAFSYLESDGAERNGSKGLAWMERAAERGQQDAQAYLRSHGDAGPLPAPFNQSS